MSSRAQPRDPGSFSTQTTSTPLKAREADLLRIQKAHAGMTQLLIYIKREAISADLLQFVEPLARRFGTLSTLASALQSRIPTEILLKS